MTMKINNFNKLKNIGDNSIRTKMLGNNIRGQQLSDLVAIDNDYVLMQESKQHSILPRMGLGTVLEQENSRAQPLVNNSETAPAALRSEMFNAAPVFMESTPGSVTITHREMITPVYGITNTDTFPLNFRIQPANPDTFPWLHKIANLFETYTFTKLKFIYVPRVPTSYSGQIGLAIDFDADDLPANSLMQFSSYRNNVIGSIWSGIALGVEGEALQKCVVERYTDHMITPHTYDPILHDVGNLRVAVLSPESEVVLGQIYVEYTIILRTPEPPSGSSAELITMAKYVGQGTLHFNHPLGTDETKAPVITYTSNDIPVGAVYHPTDQMWHLQIQRLGKYAIWIRYVLSYSAGEWDTAAKATGNADITWTNSGYGYIANGFWPFNEGRVEIGTNTTTIVTADMQLYVEITNTGNYIVPAITIPGAAGLSTGSTIIQVNFIVREVANFPVSPTLNGNFRTSDELRLLQNGNKNVKFPTLTAQQKAHPLGSIWSDAINEAYALSKPAMKFLYNRYFGGGKSKKKMKNHKNLTKLHKAQKKRSKK